MKDCPKKTAVYFCRCGGIISNTIDPETIQKGLPQGIDFRIVDFLCSEEGKGFLSEDIKDNNIQRVLIAACSPREQEAAFRSLLSLSGLNPYLMQMVNIREHIAWVTEDKEKATAKALRHIRAGILRSALQESLEPKEVEAVKDVLVIGAGPAGLKAALCLAESARQVILVEKSAFIGGLPVLFEEAFPDMECGPCMLEPLMAEVLQGEYEYPVRLMTLSEVIEVEGYFGNFTLKVKQSPRYIDPQRCVGCGECVRACPKSSEKHFGILSTIKKAIDFPFPGALPNVPRVDSDLCIRLRGQECHHCISACPIGEEVFAFQEQEKILDIKAGAIIIAAGSSLYDCRNIDNLGYGQLRDIYSSLEFERIASSNGPSGGMIKTSYGKAPCSVAIIHCAGSLDSRHIQYCSGICCAYAFKFNHLIRARIPTANIHHLYKEISLDRKDTYWLYKEAKDNPLTYMLRYQDIHNLRIAQRGESMSIVYGETEIDADMIILCPPVIPSESAPVISDILDVPLDKFGFYESLHKCTDPVQSKLKGIYLAGSCRSPMDIQGAVNEGLSAAGSVLSALPIGKKLKVDPVVALVDEQRCSGCKVCLSLCPFKAISFDVQKEISLINSMLCQGCGLCSSACPSGAIKMMHFTTEQILAEIEGLLG